MPHDRLLLGRVEDAEAAAAGNLEHDVRALRDLVQRQVLARVLGGEVLRVARSATLMLETAFLAPAW